MGAVREAEGKVARVARASDPSVEDRVSVLEVQVAKLSTDMEWVKKLATTNVIISATTLISMILSLMLLLSHIH